jgi:hypothetical protein
VVHGLFIDGYEISTVAEPGGRASTCGRRGKRFTFAAQFLRQPAPFMIGKLVVGPHHLAAGGRGKPAGGRRRLRDLLETVVGSPVNAMATGVAATSATTSSGTQPLLHHHCQSDEPA